MKILEVLIKILFPFLNKKLQFFYENQGQVVKKRGFSQRPIWIHASSGEIEYAISLIEEFKRQSPDVPLLVTHSSMSSKKSIDQLNVAMTGVIPLDTYKSVSKFLSEINPKALLISRTEIWPELIYQLHKKNIPSFLFSATFAPGSKKMSILSQFLISDSIKKMKQIFVVTDEDRENAKKLFPEGNFLALGDTRYDRVASRLENSEKINIPKHDKILVLGSTWEEDEAALWPILPELKKIGWKIILTPHEIDSQHLQKIEKQIQNLKMNYQLLSQNPNSDFWNNFDLLIVDKMGLLASLYKLAKISFVGGSFKKQVHSVMEPLGAYSPVVVGPYYLNNREAIEFMRLGCVKSAANSQTLLSAILKLDSEYDSVSQILKKEFELRKGTTLKLMQALKEQGLF